MFEPGTPNEDGGPDFRNARIRIGPTVFVGDVEIHRGVAEWLQHGHQSDPAYNGVILHVVFDGSPLQFPTVVQSGRTVPVLILRRFLSESFERLETLAAEDAEHSHGTVLKCAERNSNIGSDVLKQWIGKLARERLELKVRRFEERLRELAHQKLHVAEQNRSYGAHEPESIPDTFSGLTQHQLSDRGLWDQLLYEGIMDGLGYSKNREPFVKLARNVSLKIVQSLNPSNDCLVSEALLLGVAGLLPQVRILRENSSRDYVRVLRRHWRSIRKAVSCERLHEAEWQFFPTRPGNFPTVRIAAASVMVQKILSGDLFRTIIQIVKSSAPQCLSHLIETFSVRPGDFWKSHYHFDAPSGKPLNPLGRSRASDIVANTYLPLSLLYSRIFHDPLARKNTLDLYEAFPPLSSNLVLRRMEQQLLRAKLNLSSMRLQQGAIQLWRSYCSEGRCSECDVGKIVFKA